MNDLIIVGRREKYDKEKYYRVDVTSRSGNSYNAHNMSPFYLGPVECYSGYKALNVENGWQYSKVYPCHADEDGNPTEEYFRWRDSGWSNPEAQRHPMGKDIPLYSYWEEDGKILKLGYIEARKKIYIPLYAQAVFNNPEGLDLIKGLLKNYKSIALADFDGYNHKALGMTYYDVLNNPRKKMGHAFVMGMMVLGYVYKDGDKIVVDEEAMKEGQPNNEQVDLFNHLS